MAEMDHKESDSFPAKINSKENEELFKNSNPNENSLDLSKLNKIFTGNKNCMISSVRL